MFSVEDAHPVGPVAGRKALAEGVPLKEFFRVARTLSLTGHRHAYESPRPARDGYVHASMIIILGNETLKQQRAKPGSPIDWARLLDVYCDHDREDFDYYTLYTCMHGAGHAFHYHN